MAIPGDELRRLRVLQRQAQSPFMFESERGGPITEAGFRKQFAMWGRKAEIAFPVNPHALRHACGYYLANRRVDTRRIQDYLGHKSIQSTVRYTQLSGTAFVGLFD